MYSLIKPLLFKLDPETAHQLVMGLAPLARNKFIANLLKPVWGFEDSRLEVAAFGLNFKSPIGLAAGIDKSCRAIEFLSLLGPASIEVGVVSAKAQVGNERPRIFRFPEQQAIINRMGNPNIGADAAVLNLQATRARSHSLPQIGLNIGKTTATPIEEAAQDYLYTFSKLYQQIDYFIINVSCPNVIGYSKMQEKERLLEILVALRNANTQKKPILVKLAPDLTDPQLDDVLECSLETGVAGVIATNTTLSRDGMPSSAPTTGGMSGRPLFPLSKAMVIKLRSRLGGKLPIVAVGGISSVEDVITMLRSGASLVELYTALIYQGPGLISRLKRGIIERMDKDGVKSILEYRM